MKKYKNSKEQSKTVDKILHESIQAIRVLTSTIDKVFNKEENEMTIEQEVDCCKFYIEGIGKLLVDYSKRRLAG